MYSCCVVVVVQLLYLKNICCKKKKRILKPQCHVTTLIYIRDLCRTWVITETGEKKFGNSASTQAFSFKLPRFMRGIYDVTDCTTTGTIRPNLVQESLGTSRQVKRRIWSISLDFQPYHGKWERLDPRDCREKSNLE